MKKLIIAISVFIFSGCGLKSPMQYSYVLLDGSEIETMTSSSLAEISIKDVTPYAIAVMIENKTDELVFIDWNQSSINGAPIYSGSLIADTLRPESGTMPPTVIPKNDYSLNIILPMTNVRESSVIETSKANYSYTQSNTDVRYNSQSYSDAQ